MLYYRMNNDPFTRNRVTHSHVWWSDGFSLDELNKIEKLCDSDQLTKALTIDDDELKIRKSKINFFARTEETSWIFDRFNSISEAINDKFYGFDLYGYDSFQYTVYEPGEEYNWHTDLVFGNEFRGAEARATRKLSLIMLLSDPEKDFTGGEFQINQAGESTANTIEMTKGRIIAFPSFMLHRVKPVISGIRKSIVIWIEGPKFR